MHALTIPFDMIHNEQELVIKGQRLERVVNTYLFLLLLTIIIIHILTGILLFTYNSVDIQACYLAQKANIIVQLDC